MKNTITKLLAYAIMAVIIAGGLSRSACAITTQLTPHALQAAPAPNLRKADLTLVYVGRMAKFMMTSSATSLVSGFLSDGKIGSLTFDEATATVPMLHELESKAPGTHAYALPPETLPPFTAVQLISGEPIFRLISVPEIYSYFYDEDCEKINTAIVESVKNNVQALHLEVGGKTIFVTEDRTRAARSWCTKSGMYVLDLKDGK